MRSLAGLSILAALVAGPAPAGAQSTGGASVVPPAPTSFVTDAPGFLSAATRQRLERRLAEHQRATGQQVIVWIGNPPLNGGELQPWAVKAFRAWQVGRQGKDDGVAIFLAPQARKAWIEV